MFKYIKYIISLSLKNIILTEKGRRNLMDLNENIIENLNQPLIDENINQINHKTFLKYTSELYNKYILDLLNNLCRKYISPKKTSIFFKSISYLLKVLYYSKNKSSIATLDMYALCCFYLSIKSIETQKKIPNITKLKNLYKDKYKDYKTEDIKRAEITCLKLLNYNINIMTAYDCLCYLYGNNTEMIEKPKDILEMIMKKEAREYILKTPMELAQECIEKAKNKNYEIENKYNKIKSNSSKSNIRVNSNKRVGSSSTSVSKNYRGNLESVSTSSSSGVYSNQSSSVNKSDINKSNKMLSSKRQKCFSPSKIGLLTNSIKKYNIENNKQNLNVISKKKNIKKQNTSFQDTNDENYKGFFLSSNVASSSKKEKSFINRKYNFELSQDNINKSNNERNLLNNEINDGNKEIFENSNPIKLKKDNSTISCIMRINKVIKENKFYKENKDYQQIPKKGNLRKNTKKNNKSISSVSQTVHFDNIQAIESKGIKTCQSKIKFQTKKVYINQVGKKLK